MLQRPRRCVAPLTARIQKDFNLNKQTKHKSRALSRLNSN